MTLTQLLTHVIKHISKRQIEKHIYKRTGINRNDLDYREGDYKMSTGSFKHNVVISDKNAAKTLLDALEKASGPDNLNQEQNCFVPNGSTYPLCIGNGSPECEKCCVYENMDEPPFEK